jgi:hypothetical protein
MGSTVSSSLGGGVPRARTALCGRALAPVVSLSKRQQPGAEQRWPAGARAPTRLASRADAVAKP